MPKICQRNLLPRGGQVNAGLRWVLLGINAFLLICGTAMVVLGILLAQYRTTHDYIPDLWWLGVMPLTIGLVGMISAVVGHSQWLLAWAIYSTLTGVGSYVFFVRTGYFDPTVFDVTMNIYGACSQENDGCVCVWSSNAMVISNKQTCDIIKLSTNIYLSQMILLTLSLAAAIIGCFLGSVVTCCANHCVIQPDESQSLLAAAGNSGLHSTPTLNRNTSQGCTYMTDYTSPRKTRTYIPGKGTSTML